MARGEVANEDGSGATIRFRAIQDARNARHSGLQPPLKFPGDEAFKLYDTFGFPIDLTRLMAEERGLHVDMAAFDALMEEQRTKARGAAHGSGAAGEWTVVSQGPDSAFTGYQSLEEQAEVRRWRRAGGQLHLVLDKTPFYAESGGQVGDQGRISGASGAWKVIDTQKEGDRILHICEASPATGAAPDAEPVTATVDGARRARTTLNHTATHLLHAALRKVLGEHVTQAGSIVHPDSLRFDYHHFEKPSDAQLEQAERLVATEIRRNQGLNVYESAYDAAVKSGVMALFGAKNGDRLRAGEVGPSPQ